MLMTLEELADTLPNGFHDAQVSSLSIDYIKREARLLIDLWVSDSPSDSEELREAYRKGELKLSGLLYWVPSEVAERTLVLHAMLQIYFGAPIEVIASWIKTNQLDFSLSRHERSLLTNGSVTEQETTNLYCYIEALWAMVWAGQLNNYSTEPFNMDVIMERRRALEWISDRKLADWEDTPDGT